MSMIHTARFRLVRSSIVIAGYANRVPVEFILDTGDAIGPVLNSADAGRTGAQQGPAFGVSGAGGATTSYETEVDISFGGTTWHGEPGAIDTNLEGPSLLGLPFFTRNFSGFYFDINNSLLVMVG